MTGEAAYEQLKSLLDVAKEKPDEWDMMTECPCCGSSDGLHIWLDDDDELGVHCFPCGASIKEVFTALDLLEADDEPTPTVTIRRSSSVPVAGPASSWEAYAAEKQLDLDKLVATVPELENVSSSDPVRFYFTDGVYKERTANGFRWEGGKAKEWRLWPPTEGFEEKLPERLYITEGETDALTLLQLDLPTRSITGGADPKGALSTGHYIGLKKRGVREVVLCHDADEAGLAWYRAEEPLVVAAGLSVGRVDLTPFYDRWGYGIKDINDLWQDCETAEEFLETLEEHTTLQELKATITLDEWLELADEEIEWLVSELVSPNEKGLIIGEQKSFKTWIALNLMYAVATGAAFLDREDWSAEAGSPVLLIEEEGSLKKFSRRIKAVFRNVPEECRGNLHSWFRHGFLLTSDDHVNELIAYIRSEGIKLVVLDPLQRMMPGIDENSSSETAVVWDNIHRIAGECAIIVIHHMNKSKIGLDWNAIRGSSRTGGEVDFALFVKHAEEQPHGEHVLHMHVDGRDLVKHENQDGYLEVRFPKERPWEMSASGWKVVISSPQARSAGRILEALESGEATMAELQQATGLTTEAVKKGLQGLLDQGRILKTDESRLLSKGSYRLAPEGGGDAPD